MEFHFLSKHLHGDIIKLSKTMKIVIATQNPGKLVEIKALLADLNFEISDSREAGYNKEIIEDGKTFSENALIKARTIAKALNLVAIGDDSGICLDDLNGQPGVYSSRWGGNNLNREKLAKFTLKKLEFIPGATRKASFISVIALVDPTGKEEIFEGRVDGKISLKLCGQPRPQLAYDSIFIPDGYAKTFAEMTDEEKNQISHRGIALKKFKEFIIKSYENNKSGL